MNKHPTDWKKIARNGKPASKRQPGRSQKRWKNIWSFISQKPTGFRNKEEEIASYKNKIAVI